MPYLTQIPLSAYTALLVSFAISVLIVLTTRWHGHHSFDHSHGVQKLHISPAPRIGGVAIVVGLICAYGVARPERKMLLGPVLLAGIPAFVFGFWEDITNRVSVRARLFATMASGFFGCCITGYSITRLGIPGIDQVLSVVVISVLFTAFAIGGVANALNIIDGANGLASGFAVLAFLAFTAIALRVGDINLAYVSLTLGAAIAGFFFVNWPFGKLFLGDGGSYVSGFFLAWVAVLLVERHSTVSPFAILLVCLYPVVEVLFSMYRRRQRSMHPGHPDRHHLHSLVMLRYMKKLMPQGRYNSATGICMAGLGIPSALWAYLAMESTIISVLGIGFFILWYITAYGRIICFRTCLPWKLLFVHAKHRSLSKSDY